MKVDAAIIGGGPAGLAAALSLFQQGITDVVLLERDQELGGILQQCIHDGFGNFIFGEALTGPEYAHRYITAVEQTKICVKVNTMVLSITQDKHIVAVNPTDGVIPIEAKAIILAMGCRERTRAQLLIPGDRPAGIYTAGVAQRYINMMGMLPGKRVVIIGSGDVGLIMARRLTLEGAEVEGVYEILPHPGGLTRNVVQCLEDYGIPLHLSHTITQIQGRRRVENVTVAQVDSHMRPMTNTERVVPCDTLILSVGLIPENELSRSITLPLDPHTEGPIVDEGMETRFPGIYACGNVVHVHDLVDDVSEIAERTGQSVASDLTGSHQLRDPPITVEPGRNVRYVVPQILRGRALHEVLLYLRVNEIEQDVRITATSAGVTVFEQWERIVTPPELVKLRIPSHQLKPVETQLIIEVNPRS